MGAFLQAADLKDQLLRALADMENLRTRTRRDVDNAKQFAIQVRQQLYGYELAAMFAASPSDGYV